MKPDNPISYQKTIYACFLGYISQAAAVNFVPLLFVTFQRQYHIPLTADSHSGLPIPDLFRGS